jgi:autotransporter translocation and assembly factor TamB
MIKKISKTLLFILLILEITSVGLFFVFKSQNVRLWVLEKSLPIIHHKSGYKITITNPISKSLSNWQFGEIVVKKNNEQLIKTKNLTISFNLKNLPTKHQLIITNLDIGYLEINSSNFSQLEKSTTKNQQLLKLNPLAFEIESFQIDVLKIQTNNVAIKNQKYLLSGNVAFLTKKFPLVLNLKAKNLDGINAKTEISSTPIDNNTLRIAGFLNHKNGAINLDGKIYKEQIDATVKIKKFPIESVSNWFGYDISGNIGSDLKISGNYSNPKINGNFILPIIYKNLPLKITGSGEYKKQKINLKVESGLNLKNLDIFLPTKTQKISGLAKANLDIAGDISKPQISGKIIINNGNYQNWDIGLAINNLESNISLKNNQIIINQFTANNGKDGKVALNGGIDLNQKFVDLNLKLEKAQIINRSDINGKADGSLALKGNFDNLQLYGNVDVRPLSLILNRLSSNEINSLEITEVNKKQNYIENNFIPNVNLDIHLKSDKQAYLIGKGLNAQLKGEIKIYGDIKSPQYAGSFQTIGGRYDLLGKRFILQNGKVEFQSDSFQFIIPATYSKKDLEINAKIYGNNEDFKIDLSSTPAMTTNDIISNILFGKSSLSINPLQAIRLAQTLNDINNNQSSFDPIHSTKNLLKLDNLEFDSEETDKGKTVSVGVGKYISEDVYVELQKSSDPAQFLKGSIEIEITPHLSLKSDGNSENLGSIGLEWKKDY